MNESLVAFRREVLKYTVADLCRRAGWESVTCRVMDVLVELLEKYMLKLSTTAKAFSELYNRQSPNLTDMWLSYKQNGIDLPELYEYLENFDEQMLVPEVPVFPAQRSCLQNEEKVAGSKHKHAKHKTDNNLTSSALSLERKSSTANVQAVVQKIKEKPAKAKASAYQMQSILGVDSRSVDAEVHSTAPCPSRRQLPQQPVFPLDVSFTTPHHHHHRQPLMPSNHHFADNAIYNNAGYSSAVVSKNKQNFSDDEVYAVDDYQLSKTLPLDEVKNGWDDGKEDRRLRRRGEAPSCNKHLSSKNKGMRVPNSVHHSTPTAALIANLKKPRKATIKEAFLAKKRLHPKVERTLSPNHSIHHTPIKPPSTPGVKLPGRKLKTDADVKHTQQAVKKKPGRKPKKKNVFKTHKSNINPYNLSLLEASYPSLTPLNQPLPTAFERSLKQEVCLDDKQQQNNNNIEDNNKNIKYNNNKDIEYNNKDIKYNNNKDIEYNNKKSAEYSIDKTDEYNNKVEDYKHKAEECKKGTHSLGKEEVVVNDDDEEVLPWTDAENSPQKNTADDHNNASFVNVCDNNSPHNKDNGHSNQSPIPAAKTRFSMDTSDLPDVSKVTGLELILGHKQDSNNGDFDTNSHHLENDKVEKRKTKKKSKKQKKEAREADRLDNIDNYVDSYDHNDDYRFNNNSNNNHLSTLATEHKDEEGNFRDVGRGNEEDKLSTLVSVAMDKREEMHDLNSSHHFNLPPPSQSSTPFNKNNNNSIFPLVNLSAEAHSQKKKKKKKSKKRRHDVSMVPEDETSKKPKMDEQPSLPKLTLKFGGNTVCGGRSEEVPTPPPPPAHQHSNRPKGPIKLVIKPFSGMRHGPVPPSHHSPSQHSGSSMLPSSRSQSPDDLARLAIGQRNPRSDIYDSDHSGMRRSPIYSDSPSPPHNVPVKPPHNFPHNMSHHHVPHVTPASVKRSKCHNPIKTTPVIAAPTKLAKPPKTPASRGRNSKRSDKAGKITRPNGEVIWICPTCGFPDNGSPMIGCDKCDDWYHWVCVNITEEPPEEVSWFCSFCISQASALKNSNKRGRPPGKK